MSLQLINKSKVFFKESFIQHRYLMLLIFISHFICCNNVSQKNKNFKESYIEVNSKYLIIQNYSIEPLPDSIFKFRYHYINIIGMSQKNMEQLIMYLKPDSIKEFEILEFPSQSFDFNLKKFISLNKLVINGNELKSINYDSIFTIENLEYLDISSNYLEFPHYKKGFKKLRTFKYFGISQKIPKWLDELDNLENFKFDNTHHKLDSINVDICNLKKVKIFDFSNTDRFQKEIDIIRKGRKGLFFRYKMCKPQMGYYYNE